MRWVNRLRKLWYLLTPHRVAFCNRNPWLSGYEIGEWSYGRPRVLSWGEGTTLKMGRFCSIGGNVTIFLGGEHRADLPGRVPRHRNGLV